MIPRDVALGLAVLELVPPVTQEAVSGRFRQLARRLHPDAGGSGLEMVALGRAKDAVVAWLGDGCPGIGALRQPHPGGRGEQRDSRARDLPTGWWRSRSSGNPCRTHPETGQVQVVYRCKHGPQAGRYGVCLLPPRDQPQGRSRFALRTFHSEEAAIDAVQDSKLW